MNITGRDNYILAQALAYAIETIDRLPPRLQEKSNREDMEELLRHLITDDRSRAIIVEDVRRRFRLSGATP